MRRLVERPLLVLLGALSVVLTGLTVWAVSWQSEMLAQRELEDLKNEARRAVALRNSEVRNLALRDAERSLRLWQTAQLDDLNAWAAEQSHWSTVCLITPVGTPQVLPLTPLESVVPDVNAGPEPEPASELEDTDEPSPATQSAGVANDPRTLFTVASIQQSVGRRADAAATFAEAGRRLRESPRYEWMAFQAQIGAIDCLIAERDVAAAARAFEELLGSVSQSKIVKIGRIELEALRERAKDIAARMGGASEPSMFAQKLDELAKRVATREAFIAAVVDTATKLGAAVTPAPATQSDADRVRFAVAPGAGAIVAVVRGRNGRTVAFARSESAVIEQSWPSGGINADWRFVRSGDATTDRELAPAGLAFGGGRLVISEAGRARLSGLARNRRTLLAIVTLGSIGGWAAVLWMTYRAIKRQREYFQLQQRFVADVSHELKTPLALIRLSAETLRDRRVIDPHRTHSYLDTIVRESERLTGLLDSILDFSRIESGQHAIRIRECDVASVARQAWALFEPQFARDGFEARLEIQPDLPTIKADGQSLQQVLVNLLQNAYRYSGERRHIRLAVAREGFLIVFTVEDRGIGMSRTQLDRLGDSFFRADDTRVRQQRGTGLGLAIVNHIVTAHRGKLEVHSRPGEGSRFTVWIPFDPQTEATA